MALEFTSRKAFTVLIAAIIIHNAEEAFTICKYPVESPVSFIQPVSCNQFLCSVSILTVAILMFYIFAMRTEKDSVYLFISNALSAALLLNVLVPHVFIAIYTFNYTPGLISAVALNLPLCIIVLIKNRLHFKNKLLFIKQISAGLLLGYLLFGTIMLLTLWLVD